MSLTRSPVPETGEGPCLPSRQSADARHRAARGADRGASDTQAPALVRSRPTRAIFLIRPIAPASNPRERSLMTSHNAHPSPRHGCESPRIGPEGRSGPDEFSLGGDRFPARGRDRAPGSRHGRCRGCALASRRISVITGPHSRQRPNVGKRPPNLFTVGPAHEQKREQDSGLRSVEGSGENHSSPDQVGLGS